MSQGNVASWQVNEGAEITAGDILADIETDKATLPWENQDDGFIAKLLKPSGSKDVPVGTPLIVLVEEKEHIGDFKDFSPEGAGSGASTQQDKPKGTSSSCQSCPDWTQDRTVEYCLSRLCSHNLSSMLAHLGAPFCMCWTWPSCCCTCIDTMHYES